MDANEPLRRWTAGNHGAAQTLDHRGGSAHAQKPRAEAARVAGGRHGGPAEDAGSARACGSC
jgi:hypothetical protein